MVYEEKRALDEKADEINELKNEADLVLKAAMP
jgi:hypothetical protein